MTGRLEYLSYEQSELFQSLGKKPKGGTWQRLIKICRVEKLVEGAFLSSMTYNLGAPTEVVEK